MVKVIGQITRNELESEQEAGLRSQCAALIRKLKAKGISSQSVLAAVQSIPRYRFVDRDLASLSYDDIPLPIGYQQTIFQRFVPALMTEKLIDGSSNRRRVLEIGTGCGYQTAVLSRIYDAVYSVERIWLLYFQAKDRLKSLGFTNIKFQYGDGYDGWEGESRFDGILFTAAPKYIPWKIASDLAEDGSLVLPISDSRNQVLKVIRKRNNSLCEIDGDAVRFVPIVRGLRP